MSAGLSASETAEIDKEVSREAQRINQELEIERILKSFKLNPFEVLDIDYGVDDKTIKAIYRKKSLLIHPDKVKHERAVEAFDLLKKAEAVLSTPEKRYKIDCVVSDARMFLIKDLKLPLGVHDDHPSIKELHPPFKLQVKEKMKHLMVEDELRRRRAIKTQLANEGAEARKKDEEIDSKKRKAEEKKDWESNRDNRISDWRSFQKGDKDKKKRKKEKMNVLG
ncbi:hypothetical protein E3P92_01061 [Wallemia ichthyophaga]|uniref:J domain-containing protein n=2 Tax=Wallemia ichthyophaga TaxID=245174 RepID=A0A4T0HN02_WALIC|nr:J domain-containing protein spf31 [Wallemia ichthyophaga EXF-994]TIA79540.1 hypothetical protein E3P98_03224 [Wallemia ichthyophaga]EOR04646.1 J domain-containing protein spf31 [Wallemia ichthyophaga EXF-994]TIA93010.1 hypothetical protein E3P97_01189 [Wallemia ichthyophaga]TIB02391.1 hypothetical protein E3P95_01012 [Wallemia ichthyophaga]TIB03284.1 hypothetical protein E3P94_01144 [Wallemia ichthyophaga]